MKVIVRDFTTCLGTAGPSFAIVHVAGACSLLEEWTVRDEAIQRQGIEVGLSGVEYPYNTGTVEEAEAAHRARWTVDVSMRRHTCVEQHVERVAARAAAEHVADDTIVIYDGSKAEFSGRRLRAAACRCRDGECDGYELEDPRTDRVLLRHVRRSSITPVDETSAGRADVPFGTSR